MGGLQAARAGTILAPRKERARQVMKYLTRDWDILIFEVVWFGLVTPLVLFILWWNTF